MVSDTTYSQDKLCVEGIAIEPRTLVDGIWIPSSNTHVSGDFEKKSMVVRSDQDIYI